MGRGIDATFDKTYSLKNDSYRLGDKIKVYLCKVSLEFGNDLILTLSRIHQGFVRELLKLRIFEIRHNIIKIKRIAREPGIMTKIAVHSSEDIDPAIVCRDRRGNKIKSI